MRTLQGQSQNVWSMGQLDNSYAFFFSVNYSEPRHSLEKHPKDGTFGTFDPVPKGARASHASFLRALLL